MTAERSISWRSELGHSAALAEHGHPVGELEDLVHPVADVDDRHALCGERSDDSEQSLLLGLRESGRRLVHHEHPDLAGDGDGDLDELALTEGETFAELLRRQTHAEPAERVGRQFGGALAVRAPGAAESLARVLQQEVVGDRQTRDDRQRLVDDGDAVSLGIARTSDLRRVAVDADRAVSACTVPAMISMSVDFPASKLASLMMTSAPSSSNTAAALFETCWV